MRHRQNKKSTRCESRTRLDTATAGPRTVPVRSGLSGIKTPEFSRPPRPSDVLRAGTARAPVEVSSWAANRLLSAPVSDLRTGCPRFTLRRPGRRIWAGL